MDCKFQNVGRDEWQLADALPAERRERLLNGATPCEILDRLRVEFGRSQWQPIWEQCTTKGKAAFWRLNCQVEVPEELFDQFLNGHAGYRAQFYLSPACGALYNRAVIDILETSLSHSYPANRFPWTVALSSIRGCWSKVWVTGDEQDSHVFRHARTRLAISRWLDAAKAGRVAFGLNVPLPPPPQLDFKGTWIDPRTGKDWVSSGKVSRSLNLYETGYT